MRMYMLCTNYINNSDIYVSYYFLIYFCMFRETEILLIIIKSNINILILLYLKNKFRYLFYLFFKYLIPSQKLEISVFIHHKYAKRNQLGTGGEYKQEVANV